MGPSVNISLVDSFFRLDHKLRLATLNSLHAQSRHAGPTQNGFDFSSWRRIDDNAIPPRGKISGAYVNPALAKSEALLTGFDEALVLNANGHLAEGSAENIFIVRNGVAITPPVSDNILEGITRSTVIDLLINEVGVEVVERPVDRTEVLFADEAFFCGTGVQIAAITRAEHRPVGDGKMGPVTAELRDLYFGTVRGANEKYQHWCTPVYAAQTISLPAQGF